MANATILYVCTGNGLIIMTKPGTLPEWLPPRQVLEGARVTSAWAEPGPPIRVAAVASGALMLSDNGGRSWSDAQLPAPVTYLFSFGEPPILIAAHEGGTLSASPDSGATWQSLKPLPQRGNVFAASTSGDQALILLEQVGECMLLSGNPRTGVRHTLVMGETITSIATDSVTGTVYGAFSDGLRRSRNGGISWYTLANSPPAALALAVVPGATGKPPAIVVGTTMDLRVSQDGGITWQEMALGEGGRITALARDPERRDRLYAATSRGYLFESGNRGQTWEQINSEPLPAARYMYVMRI